MSNSNYTILVIDYEPRSIQAAKKTLEAAGYEIVVATDGLQGLTAFEQMKPGLVLIEAMIPKKHGFEVCQEIKKTPNGKTTPVVITTAVYRGRKYRTQALHIYGCDDYLEKPYPDDVLLKVCERFLGKPTAASQGQEEDEAMATPMAASGGGAAVSLPPTPTPTPVAEPSPEPVPEPVQEAVASAAPVAAPKPAEPVVPMPAGDVTAAPTLDDEINDRVDALLGGGLFDAPKEAPAPEPPAEAEDEIDNILQFESPADPPATEPEVAPEVQVVPDEEVESIETLEAADAADEMAATAEDGPAEDPEPTPAKTEAAPAPQPPAKKAKTTAAPESDEALDLDELPETPSTLMLEKNQGLPAIAKVLVAVAVLAAAGAVVWMVWFQ